MRIMPSQYARFDMPCWFGTLLLTAICAAAATADAAPDVAKRIVASESGVTCLKPDAWKPVASGFQKMGDAWECDNGNDPKEKRGLVQAVVLHQSKPEAIVATAWSRGENVIGSPDADYAIYLDIACADGSHLWGQSAFFATGTHDWQQRRVVVMPEKPIETVTYYLLFRNRSGKVWFRDPQLSVVKAAAGAVLFDGLAVETAGTPCEGFQIRDVAAGGEFLHIDGQALGLNLAWQTTQAKDATFFDVTLKNVTPTKGPSRNVALCNPDCGRKRPVDVRARCAGSGETGV